MNIILLANKDLPSNYALNLLFPQLNQHKLHLFLSSKIGHISTPGLKRLKFFEQDLFNHIISENILLPQKRSSDCLSFKQMNRYLCAPYQELNEINEENSISQIKSIAPDLIISIRYGVILKKPIISIPRHGVINLHSGILPQYRGVMATFWALLNDEKSIGTTLHFIDDPSIDTGAIIARTTIKCDYNRSYLWHVLSLYKLGIKEIIRVATRLSKQQSITATLQKGSGHYYSFPKHDDLHTFSNKGLKLVDENHYLDFIRKNYY